MSESDVRVSNDAPGAKPHGFSPKCPVPYDGHMAGALPMSLSNVNSVHIHPVHEPPVSLRNLDIIPAHLPLSHAAILRKRPVLEAITTLPLHSVISVLVLIPELDSDLVVRESEQFLAQAALNGSPSV